MPRAPALTAYPVMFRANSLPRGRKRRLAARKWRAAWLSDLYADQQHRAEEATRLKFAFLLTAGLALLGGGANASTMWKWSYQGEGVTASGAFTTKDAPNADGFYEI